MADLHSDIFSIKQIVKHAKSKKDALNMMHNTHGFSLPKQIAHRVLEKEFEAKDNKKKAQASYRKNIESKYQLVEAALDAETIQRSLQLLKNNPKFKELKKYYDNIRKDLVETNKLSSEEAGSIINYAIHK